jgi:hypothetical protein
VAGKLIKKSHNSMPSIYLNQSLLSLVITVYLSRLHIYMWSLCPCKIYRKAHRGLRIQKASAIKHHGCVQCYLIKQSAKLSTNLWQQTALRKPY